MSVFTTRLHTDDQCGDWPNGLSPLPFLHLSSHTYCADNYTLTLICLFKPYFPILRSSKSPHLCSQPSLPAPTLTQAILSSFLIVCLLFLVWNMALDIARMHWRGARDTPILNEGEAPHLERGPGRSRKHNNPWNCQVVFFWMKGFQYHSFS